ncbi:unnamed protein product [Linum trigynum]|uniref:Ubiquitin-conjugating enzyme E2C-binding protein n=1 Tax=Linum trigynum TaxID=586398 RepID=A0AAV2CYG6_9ROSI
MNPKNPRKWRFTWEAQSHAPNLKLFVFDAHSRPSKDCHNLSVNLKLSQSHVLVSWTEEDGGGNVSLKIPIPKVLIDPEVPVSFRALHDHIEVKVVLLLPVDHPIVSSFDSVLNLSDDGGVMDGINPLVMNSDLKSLSSTQGANFYCRRCSAKLTKKAIRNFEEMPSVNWREVADNWFGGCCCSYGGAGEVLVNSFADGYGCRKGVGLLSSPAVILCMDDILGCEPRHQPLDRGGGLSRELDDNGTDHASVDENQSELVGDSPTLSRDDQLSGGSTTRNMSESATCCDSKCHGHEGLEPSKVDVEATRATKFTEDQKSFLNGFLGDAFMVRSYSRSVDIEWKEFFCPQCSSLLGAYPSTTSGHIPIDNGIRLFKCYISSCLPVCAPSDIFRRYTLEKMFTNMLVENAKDELSYRTVVRDLATRSPMLQVVLLNLNSWCCTGICWDDRSPVEPVLKLNLKPIIKVLFSSSIKTTESSVRLLEDWMVKHAAEEAFVIQPLIHELVETMESSKHNLPSSPIQVENMSLATLLR